MKEEKEEKFVVKIKQVVPVSDTCIFSIIEQPERLRGMFTYSCEETKITVESFAHPEIKLDKYGEGSIYIRGRNFDRDNFESTFDKKFVENVVKTLVKFCEYKGIPYKFIIEINKKLGEIQ